LGLFATLGSGADKLDYFRHLESNFFLYDFSQGNIRHAKISRVAQELPRTGSQLPNPA